MCDKVEAEKADLISVGRFPPQDDVDEREGLARASSKHDDEPRVSDSEIPIKKRKTRRGRSKRKNVHPYRKSTTKSNNVVKPEAPYNSNRFLIEDHGDIDEDDFKKTDQASTSTITRTRDSSFSVDSDGEFYSTPDDEEEFLIKDFDDQYESLQAERLHSISKDELIQELLAIESKVELLTKRLRKHGHADTNNSNDVKSSESNDKGEAQKEIQRLTLENDKLKRENDILRSATNNKLSSDSVDSETDSTGSSSTSSLSTSDSRSPIDYKQTNGHVENVQPV